MVTRVFAGGRLLSTAMRWATTTRGKLSISQEEDPVRHRRVLVARLSTGSNGMKVVPPLYDVVVVGCTGEWWTIAEGSDRAAICWVMAVRDDSICASWSSSSTGVTAADVPPSTATGPAAEPVLPNEALAARHRVWRVTGVTIWPARSNRSAAQGA